MLDLCADVWYCSNMCEIGNEVVTFDKGGYVCIDISQIMLAIYGSTFLTKKQLYLARYGKSRVRKKWKTVLDKRFSQYLKKKRIAIRKQWAKCV